jgi:hypothetical protein
MALHSVFLAGLTLVYCIWISPKEVFGIKTSNDINACSIVLYIITERWPGAKKYRDVFENVKQTVLESIEANGYEERKAIKDLTPSLYETWKGLDEGTEGRNEFEAMVGEMAGELKRSDKPKAVQRPETGSATSAFTFEIPSGGVGSDSAHSAVGVDFGRSPSTFSNQWLLGIDSGVGVEGFSIWEPELNELQFPME